MSEAHPQADEVRLRDVVRADLDEIFEQMRDPRANRMAAFGAKDPDDRAAFDARWSRIFASPSVVKRAIVYRGAFAGHLLKFDDFGRPEIGYWIGAEYWGRGIATRALQMFVELIEERPLFAHVASDNLASQRVLEKSGFEMVELGSGFSYARGERVEELVFRLGGSGA